MSTAAAMLLAVCAYAQQYSITGKVVDGKTNQALSGATVQLQEIGRYAVTDDFGSFNFSPLAAGNYTVRIRFLGFKEHVEVIALQENINRQFTLDESFEMTDEVVVQATRANEKSATTFSTVNRQALQKQNFGQDLPFLLNWTPSVVTTSDAGTGIGYTGIRIRGSDATRVNVTINGIPYNDSESLGTFWVDIPDIASSSQSIQVQRGVGTSTNGAGAFGASINLQTNTRNDLSYGEIISSAGSFGTFRNTLSLGTGLINNHWVIDGRISNIVSNGFIDRASSELSSYYFAAGFYAGKTMVKAIAFGGQERTYQSWYGVPESRLNNDTEAMMITAMNEGWNEIQTENLLNSDSRTFNPYLYKNQVDDYKQNHYQLHFAQQVNDFFSANLSLHYTPGKGYYEEYKYDDDFENYGLSPVTIGDSVIESADIIRRRWLDNDFYGFTYSLQYEKEKWNVILGGGWNRYDGDHFGEIIWSEVSAVPAEHQYYFNAGDKRDFNIYWKANYQFVEKLNGYIDLQYRNINYEATGIESKLNVLDIDKQFNFFNPKAGLTYSLANNQHVYASFSVANREPVRDDFVDAPGGNPKPERLYNVEAGHRIAGKNFTLNSNFYWMQYKNQLVLTGELNDVGASVRTNVDQSYRMGIEVEALLKLTEQLYWNANVTLSQNKIKDFYEINYNYGDSWEFDPPAVETTHYKQTDISFSPNIVAASGLTYRPFKNLEVALLSKYVGRQYLDNTSNADRSIDAYFVNDLRLGYTIRPTFMKEIGLSFLLNNLLDETYESNGYTWGYSGGGENYRENYYYPQAGRNFMVMVALKF